MSNKKIFEAGGGGMNTDDPRDIPDLGFKLRKAKANQLLEIEPVPDDKEAETKTDGDSTATVMRSDGGPAYDNTPAPSAPNDIPRNSDVSKSDPTPADPPQPDPTPTDPTPTDPHGGLLAIPWKQIAIVAGAAGLLAALIALVRKCTKSIKLRFNKSVRTLARMQKDFTISKKGLDMRAVLPSVGSKLNDFITRVFSGSAFAHNGRTRVMGNTKSARKFKDGVIGLYPFCDIYKEEIRNDLAMAQTTFNKIKFAADSTENSSRNSGNANNNESVNGPVYQSFNEAFASERLNESENGQVNESAIMALSALAPMVIRGGMFIINKIKDGKADPKETKTVQVTKQSTREICYAILNNFFEKYISFEQVSKKMGVDVKGLSDIDESTIDKFQTVLKKYQNPDGASVVKQYARVKSAYDKMLGHYLNIGNGIIRNFEKYTKAEDEKHENLLVASKEKLQAMWDQQQDQYERLFPYVLNEIINDGAYAQYIDFIIERVLPVFKTGIAGDADYVLDVMPKKGEYFLLSQTAHPGTIGNKAICRITSDYNKDTKNIGMSLIALYKGGTDLTPEGNIKLTDNDSDKFDTKAYKAAPIELDYHRFMALDPRQIVNIEEILNKNMKLDLASFVDKEILALGKDVEIFNPVLSELGKSDVTAVVYKIKAIEGNEITYAVEYISSKKDIASRVNYDKTEREFSANKEDFETVTESEENMKEYKLPTDKLTEKPKPVVFSDNIQSLDRNTKFTFTVNNKGKTVSYEGFVNQGKNAQELFLKATLTVSNDEEKEENNENDKSNTFVKIARANIDKEVNSKDIVDYLTDTYGAKFEKMENDEFAKALTAEANANQSLVTLRFPDITTLDQTSNIIRDIAIEVMNKYKRQINNKDTVGKEINEVLQTYWMKVDEKKRITFIAIPYMDDESNMDENPPLTGVIIHAETYEEHTGVGKLNVSADFNKVSEDMQKLGYKYYSNIEEISMATTLASIRKTKPEDIKITADWKSDEDYNKFIQELCASITGFDDDMKKISNYMIETVNNAFAALTITIKPEDNKQEQPNQSNQSNQQQRQPNQSNQRQGQSARQGQPAQQSNGKNSETTKENVSDSLNEVQAASIDPKTVLDALKVKNIIVDVKREELEDGTKIKKVGDNIITIEFAKLLYKASDERYKNLTVILEFCCGRTGKSIREYALISSIIGSDGNPIKKVMRGMVVWGRTIGLPSADYLCNNYLLPECKDAKMNVVMGEMPKQEESLNEKKMKVQESINFTATYATNDKVIESAVFNTGINRKITADKDCSQYYVLSECMWSCANDETVKKALTSKVTAALKNCRTKEGLMEYAKANQNAEFTKNFADMSYVARKPGNFHYIIGCSLFECAVAVKFNSNNIISNAIGIGVNKII